MITIGFIDLKKEKRGNMENKIDAEALLYLISQEESEIIEYKKDNTDPEQIGKYVSALANSAALLGREEAYMIWGIEDKTKNIIGTTFKPKQQKKGGEPFISWLERLLDPRLVIVFEEIHIEDKWVVVMILRMTVGRPISFKTQKYIRSGSSLKNLNDFPEKERELWRSFDARSFEREFAKTNCTEEEIFDLLDVNTYLQKLNYPIESNNNEILELLEEDSIIERSGKNYNITNLGAYCFAKYLSSFENLKFHAIRVVRYNGINKMSALEDTTAGKGVVVGFDGLLSYVRRLLPLASEVYEENGQRVEKTDYPSLVIRELIANQIVHQDFSVRGSLPMIEIFDNRVEISNPGAPINDSNRLMDLPPISRNEELANLFKKMHFVESRGSGIDKVIIELENELLPAPDIVAKENYTVVTLHERKVLSKMTDKEKITAIYYHSVRMFIEDSYMTNQSVRKRFGLTDRQSSQATKAIATALRSKMIKPFDENAGNKFMQYIPFWAKGYEE